MIASSASFASLILLSSIAILFGDGVEAWVSTPIIRSRPAATLPSALFTASSSSTTADSQNNNNKDLATTATSSSDDEDDDDDDFEFVEYDLLTEAEFLDSEWAVGTVFGDDVKDIKETWARLVTDEEGKNVAVWGDNSKGTWNLDVSTQFFSMSKDTLWGKNIWAGVVDDYYYLRGTVRGWSIISPASVVGQWQARRLGVDPEEAGVAPWNMPEEEEEPKDDSGDSALPESKES